MDPIYKILLDQGLAIAIVIFLMILAYKFLNVKLDVMKKQMLKELQNHRYEIDAELKKSDDNNTFTVNAEIKKIDMK